MNIIGVIPARWASTRFKGKVLADIAGKPMIQHVYERVLKSSLLSDVIIACDDDKVLEVCNGFGAKVVMTRIDHPSGSDRIAEVVKDLDVDVVINVQGDEPLIDAQVIDDLARVFKKDAECSMATVIKAIDEIEDLNNPNVVKVVTDCNGYALYFSRSMIPYNRESIQRTSFKHLGIYAYRKDFLMTYITMPVSGLEEAECLEQLRVLEAGYRIKTVITEMKTLGVDTPEDLEKVKQVIG
ncbi:MAG: 3-deoxy-manno-octulosonate cytidylyltransferase (CMP-KDO synthetase) [Candidatus Omnitrophota bacterium]|jgi:3-deoxy-manno-octulosonate cytidylyltransferase (CMP-KDO synthetase)